MLKFSLEDEQQLTWPEAVKPVKFIMQHIGLQTKSRPDFYTLACRQNFTELADGRKTLAATKLAELANSLVKDKFNTMSNLTSNQL